MNIPNSFKKAIANNFYDKELKIMTTEKQEIEITLPVSASSQVPILIPNITSITPETNALLANVLKANSLQILTTNAGFCGYNTQNIQTITIRIH